jgi:hypothetical protein
MQTEKNNISSAQIYAIHYLDNGGNTKKFPHRHKNLYNAIQQEEKRRIKVSIRYKILNNKAFKKEIYTKLKISPKIDLQSQELYNILDKLSNNQLFLILHD